MRSLKANGILALFLLGLVNHGSSAVAQTPGTFTPTGDMTLGRSIHTATLLTDGRVLITGGVIGSVDTITATAELYDPSSGTFSRTSNMSTPRRSHTATLLPDGKVLIAGGVGSYKDDRPVPVSSAELYDSATGTFTPTGDMIAGGNASGGGMATLLPNGKVFIAVNLTAQLYDPTTGNFTATGPYADKSPGVYTATILADGRILITGCDTRCEAGITELYDPGTDTFSITGPGGSDGVFQATLQMNGKVLFTGNSENARLSANAEVYDPTPETFASIGKTIWPHDFSTSTLMPDGTVLIVGSQLLCCAGRSTAEAYNPFGGTFSTVGGMTTARHSHKATLLNNGKVLITGGFDESRATPTPSAELYSPALLVPAPVLFSLSGDGRGQGAILHAETNQVASDTKPAGVGEVVEIYLTGLTDGSVIPPQVAIGGRLAEVLFFGNAPGFSGLNQVNVRVPSGIALVGAVPVHLTYLSRPSNEVTIGVQ